jgi:hypothetical protein
VRLSDAEREQLLERLSRHAAEGRLDVPELERRAAIVAAAQTREEVAAVMGDLPPLAEDRAAAARRPRWGKGHGEADAPAADWQPTNERFRDPRTNKVLRVWVDTGGGRHYVADDASS